jgi:MATE family multidrug resistance protein
MFVYKKYHVSSWPDAGLSFAHHTVERTQEFMKQSLPNLGTLLFSVISSQATTVLVGRLGERAIAASAALSTVTIPWNGTMSATTWTISGVRVGYHLGRGDGAAAKKTAWMVLQFISIVMVVVTVFFVPFRHSILSVATDDQDILSLSIKLIPAMLVSTWLNLLVGNITSGVFSGMGRPIIATILSFGFELPMSIGGVAVYILLFHGNLIGVYWWNAISGAIEVVVVLALLLASDWDHWAVEAQRRQEARPSSSSAEDEQEGGAEAEETVPLVDNQEQRDDFVDEGAVQTGA